MAIRKKVMSDSCSVSEGTSSPHCGNMLKEGHSFGAVVLNLLQERNFRGIQNHTYPAKEIVHSRTQASHPPIRPSLGPVLPRTTGRSSDQTNRKHQRIFFKLISSVHTQGTVLESEVGTRYFFRSPLPLVRASASRWSATLKNLVVH
jgi:hypothetical protein